MVKRRIEDYSLEELEKEKERIIRKESDSSLFRSVIFTIVTLIAIGLSLSYLKYPLVKVQSEAMEETYSIGDILIIDKTKDIQRDDVVLYYIGNDLLISRVVGIGGDKISIRDDGSIYLNDEVSKYGSQDTEKGDRDYPLYISEKEYFVLNDDRPYFHDSRNEEIGEISESQILGKVLVCIWKEEKK